MILFHRKIKMTLLSLWQSAPKNLSHLRRLLDGKIISKSADSLFPQFHLLLTKRQRCFMVYDIITIFAPIEYNKSPFLFIRDPQKLIPVP